MVVFDSLAVDDVEALALPIFSPVYSDADVRDEVRAEFRASANERNEEISGHLEDTEVAIRYGVVGQGHAVMEFLPCDIRRPGGVVPNSGVDKFPEALARQNSKGFRGLFRIPLAGFEGVVLQHCHADCVRNGVVDHASFGNRYEGDAIIHALRSDDLADLLLAGLERY